MVWGGGGGGKNVEKLQTNKNKIRRPPCAKSQSKNLHAPGARHKNENCVGNVLNGIFIHGFKVQKCAFYPILLLHIISFSSCRNYWGGRQTDRGDRGEVGNVCYARKDSL